MPDITSWLARLGLDKYAEAFTANEVDFDALRHLTEDDLRELGLPVGPRRKILAAIAALDDDTMSPMSSASALRSALPAREAERRQLTVVFIDLVGSTELSQRLDPEQMRDVFRAYQSAVSAEIARYEGYVAKLMGDGVLAYFGWPRAHEDDAERAVRAGLAVITAINSLKTPRGDALSVRVGIATGLVVVGDLIGEGSAQEEAVVGEAPNLAARLQSLAESNTVVASSGTQRLIAGLFETVDLGWRELKGFAKLSRAWRITGEADVESRFEARRDSSPLVGRTEELKMLLHRWQLARAGEGQVAILTGEPGIGKSRLIAAILERARAEPFTPLRYFCSAYHVNSAFHPVIRQLARATGIHREDRSDTKLDKLQVLLRRTTSDLAAPTVLLAEMLSIDASARHPPLKLTAEEQKARTGATLIDLLTATAAQQPVMMVVEDAHWIDPTTRDWLDSVIDHLRDLPILLLISFRPEFEQNWSTLPHVTHLSLSRLDHDDGAAIAKRIAGGKSLPLEVEEQILARTEGVPLFVEELTKTVIESGVLTDCGDQYVLSRSLPPLAVPSTLQDSLMARLDRLGRAKEVAQAGACIGRHFHHRLLAALFDRDSAGLEQDMRQLESSELVFRSGVPPEATYTFKHTLVQDTAYQSLLGSRRQKLHAAIAAKLEAGFPEIASAEPETLAHHYTVAGLPDQAVPCWLSAGQAALRRSANHEAIAHLNKGIELIAVLPDSEERQGQELQLQSALGLGVKATKGFGAPEVVQAFSRARALSEKLGDEDQLFIALVGEASYYMVTGNLRVSDERGQQCLKLAQSKGDESLLIEAHHRLWATRSRMGDYAAAEQHVGRGLAIYDPERHHSLTYAYSGHDPGVCCRMHSALLLWFRGYPDQALQRAREGVALAEHVSHPLSWLMAKNALTELHLMRRETGEARRLLANWSEVAIELGLPGLVAEAKFQVGWVLAQEGRYGKGLVELREGIAASTAAGSLDNDYRLCVLAEACGKCGRVAEGLSLLEEAFEIVAASGTKHRVPELLRIKGELLLRLDAPDQSPKAAFMRP